MLNAKNNQTTVNEDQISALILDKTLLGMYFARFSESRDPGKMNPGIGIHFPDRDPGIPIPGLQPLVSREFPAAQP